MKRIVLFPFALFVSGCVAFGSITTGVSHDYQCPDLDSIGELNICNAREARKIRKEDVVSSWGPPKSSGIEDDREILVYNKNLAWRGLFGMLFVVPIPLLVPTGYDETTLVFENGRLEDARTEYANPNLIACDVHSIGSSGFGCRTGW